MRLVALAGAAILSLTPLPAHAASKADQVVQQFHRLCLAEGPSFERMILTAPERAIEDAGGTTDKSLPTSAPTQERASWSGKAA